VEEVSLRLLDAAAASVGRWHVMTPLSYYHHIIIIFFLHVTAIGILIATAEQQ
jgi:hypothetical protein